MKRPVISKIFYIIFSTLVFSLNLHAQHNPVNWSASSEKISTGIYKINIEAKIESGWYVYSQTLESDMGPVPTSLDFNKNDGLELIGDTAELGNRKEGMDKAFGMNVVKYLENVIFSQEARIDPTVEEISCIVTFMTCNGEMCLPPRDVPLKIKL